MILCRLKTLKKTHIKIIMIFLRKTLKFALSLTIAIIASIGPVYAQALSPNGYSGLGLVPSATTLKATDKSPDSPGPLRLQVAAPPTTAPSAVVRSAAQCGSYRALEGCIQAGACGAVPRFQTPPFTICTAAALARRSCAAHTAHTLCRGRRGAAPPSARPRRSCAVQGVVLRYWSLRERPGRGRRAVPQYRQPDAAVGTAAARPGRSLHRASLTLAAALCFQTADPRSRLLSWPPRPPRFARRANGARGRRRR
jgi:hypothetical protein